jgi:hypothetical protein
VTPGRTSVVELHNQALLTDVAPFHHAAKQIISHGSSVDRQ